MPTSPGAEPGRDPRPNTPNTFRRTLVRVMAVQILSLLALWLLQATYAR